MLKTRFWIVTIFSCTALLNTAQSYRSSYFDTRAHLQTAYPQNRQTWQRSDNIQSDQIGRYVHNEDYSTNSQLQPRTSDWNPTQTTRDSTELKGMIKEIFEIGPERDLVVHNSNLKAEPFPQVRQQQFPENYNNRKSFQGQTFQPRRGYDEGLIFKVQRNPEGKLNIVYNGTIISQPRPHDGIGIGNRGAQSPIGLPVPTPQPSRDIVFPEDEQIVTQHQRMRPRCAETGKLFCTQVDNYPKDIIESVLQVESMKYEQLFGDDIVPELNPNISQRIDGPGEESLCMSSTKLIYPQAGLNQDNNWTFIVNQKNYTQGIRIEECVSPGKPCAMTDNFPNTYRTECRQKFIYRQLVSVNPSGNVIKDLFKLPSCCTCILKPNTN